MNQKKVVPVSDLVKKVNLFLQKHVNLSGCAISGEISNVRRVKNGHYYFDLKDDKGAISCVMWRSSVILLDFTPADGQSVLVCGTLNVYEPRGSLQLIVSSMQETGLGALAAELERRKKALEAAGYFNPAHKKPRPEWIERIAVVTGKDTAAQEDVLKTIRTRWPMATVTLYPAVVQGTTAPPDIIRQLLRADQDGHDAILLVRGGGSMEDLFCFNDENIVKTIYDLNTYIVTGIGHEIDTTLADYAADHRAVTPTAAAQWVTLDQKEIMAQLQEYYRLMVQTARRLYAQKTQELMNLESNPVLEHPELWVDSRAKSFEYIRTSLHTQMEKWTGGYENKLAALDLQLKTEMKNFAALQNQKVSQSKTDLLLASPKAGIQKASYELDAQSSLLQKNISLLLENSQSRLEHLSQMLQALGPENILAKGYSIVYANGKPVSQASQVASGDALKIQMKDGSVEATAN